MPNLYITPTFHPTATSRRIITQPTPPAIYNHSTLSLPPDELFIYGGQQGPDSNAAGRTVLLSDHLYKYSLQSQSLDRIFPNDASPVPVPRMDCAMAWADADVWHDFSGVRDSDLHHHSHFLMHGGFGSHSSKLSDLWIFDIAARQWLQIHYNGAPMALSSHTMFVSRGEIYVVRGIYDHELYTMMDDSDDENEDHFEYSPRPRDEMEVYILNLKSLQWRKVIWRDSPYVPRMRESFLAMLTEDAQQPTSGRSFLSGSQLRSGLLLFGGESENHGTLMDVWQLRRSKYTGVQWEEIITYGEEPPTKRIGAAMVWACCRWVVLFGGDVALDDSSEMDTSDASFYLLDLRTGEWQRMSITGGAPRQGRVGHSMSLLYHPVQQCWKMVMIGGRISPEETSNEIYEITLEHKYDAQEVDEDYEDFYCEAEVTLTTGAKKENGANRNHEVSPLDEDIMVDVENLISHPESIIHEAISELTLDAPQHSQQPQFSANADTVEAPLLPTQNVEVGAKVAEPPAAGSASCLIL